MEALSGLRELDRQVRGVMTSSIGSLTHLHTLRIQNNSVHGTIPADIGNCQDLSSLMLDQNAISGSLPLSLSMLQLGPIRGPDFSPDAQNFKPFFGTSDCFCRLRGQVGLNPGFESYRSFDGEFQLMESNSLCGSGWAMLGRSGQIHAGPLFLSPGTLR